MHHHALRSMDVRFFLYFLSPESAQQAARSLGAEGYDAVARPGWDDPFWLVQAGRELHETEVAGAAERIETLAASLGGEYGGYEREDDSA